MRFVTIGISALVFSHSALAQSDLGQFCETLTNGRLVERTDSASSGFVLQNEMSWLCRDNSQFNDRWSKASSQLKLGFEKFSANGRGANAKGSSDASYDQLCQEDRSDFSSFLATEYASTSFSWLQPAVESCVREMGGKGRDVFGGTTTLDPASDTRFDVRISFKFDKATGARFTGITGSDGVECFADGNLKTSAIGLEDQRNLVFTCTKPTGRPVGGYLNVMPTGTEARQTLPIRFDVPTSDPEKRWIDDLMAQVRTEISAALPSGTIASFTLDTCPFGWSDFNAADGRFLLGVKPGETPGQIGGRADIPKDGSHSHTALKVSKKAPGSQFGNDDKDDRWNTTIDGQHDHGGENRPPFTTVKFCIKN